MQDIFKNKQTYTNATTAPIKYPLSDIMPITKVGTVIKDINEKEWVIISNSVPIGCYYCTDSWRFSGLHNSEGMDQERGSFIQVKVREYYPKHSPENRLYRKCYSGYNIRIS